MCALVCRFCVLVRVGVFYLQRVIAVLFIHVHFACPDALFLCAVPFCVPLRVLISTALPRCAFFACLFFFSHLLLLCVLPFCVPSRVPIPNVLPCPCVRSCVLLCVLWFVWMIFDSPCSPDCAPASLDFFFLVRRLHPCSWSSPCWSKRGMPCGSRSSPPCFFFLLSVVLSLTAAALRTVSPCAELLPMEYEPPSWDSMVPARRPCPLLLFAVCCCFLFLLLLLLLLLAWCFCCCGVEKERKR